VTIFFAIVMAGLGCSACHLGVEEVHNPEEEHEQQQHQQGSRLVVAL